MHDFTFLFFNTVFPNFEELAIIITTFCKWSLRDKGKVRIGRNKKSNTHLRCPLGAMTSHALNKPDAKTITSLSSVSLREAGWREEQRRGGTNASGWTGGGGGGGGGA